VTNYSVHLVNKYFFDVSSSGEKQMTQQANTLEVLESLSNATSELVKKTSQSVVSVKAQMSLSTGVVLTKDGYIVTCNPVLVGCNAKSVGTDPNNDVALLKAERGDFSPIELGDSEKLTVGQYILALANPFNRNQPTTTSGIVTNVNSTIKGWRGATTIENVIATTITPTVHGGEQD
jgi:S1-C subfamily serine protease